MGKKAYFIVKNKSLEYLLWNSYWPRWLKKRKFLNWPNLFLVRMCLNYNWKNNIRWWS